MADRASALANLSAVPEGRGLTSMREMRSGSILQISAWPDTVETVEAIIAELLGISAPLRGHAVSTDSLTVATTAPGRTLIAGDSAELATRFEAAIVSTDGVVTDFSHGRVILRIEGPDASALLANCVAIDLRSDAFPAGSVAQTMIHHIDVLIHRRALDSFDLWILRGFAQSIAEWLLDAGLELSVGFRRA